MSIKRVQMFSDLDFDHVIHIIHITSRILHRSELQFVQREIRKVLCEIFFTHLSFNRLLSSNDRLTPSYFVCCSLLLDVYQIIPRIFGDLSS